jgi:hypothetical protein
MGDQFLGALDWHVGDHELDGPGSRRRHGGRGGGGGGFRGGGGRGGGGYHSAASNRQYQAQTRANRAASFAMPDVPGVPSRDAALLPASFPIVTFVAATGTNIVPVTTQPQTPYRGQRMTSIVIRNGTSAGVTAPLIAYLQVGMKPIITTINPVALEIFSQNSFDTNLLMPPTMPGVIYQLGLQLAVAVTMTDTVIAITGIIGSAVL